MGIIPARAGFTSSRPGRSCPGRDHPRTRGVYRTAYDPAAAVLGSSPHARGLPDGPVHAQAAGRIIPARAGFTRVRTSNPKVVGDHPRTRGVYPALPPVKSRTRGSSPHARGLPCDGGIPGIALGIIPARAGFTPCASDWPGHRADHPRTRGVYGNRSARSPRERGSSPHARGLPPPGGRAWVWGFGSSPHARGLRPQATDHRGQDGIIPARAGFTGAPGGTQARYRDHPRTRGVYRLRTSTCHGPDGSSPHARGLLINLP